MIKKFLLITTSLTLISGCFPAMVATTAAAGFSIAQERSVGEAVDDTTLWTRIKNEYARSDFNQLFAKVRVKVSQGRVFLRGSVTNADTRVKAVQIAWAQKGVKEVINEIEVTDKNLNLKQFALDSWITTQVRTGLLAEPGISSINYSIDTINGTVYIMGVARNQAELDHVMRVARSVSHVKKVVSYVAINNYRESYGSSQMDYKHSEMSVPTQSVKVKNIHNPKSKKEYRSNLIAEDADFNDE